MLLNPFTPSEIATQPADFFGREEELRTVERAMQTSSVAIQGPIGIGKSSLLARSLLLMEGFDSTHNSRAVVCVGHRDVDSVDNAARLVLESMVDVDKRQAKLKFKIGPVLEIESYEVCRNFEPGRHLAALRRLLERDYLDRVVAEHEHLIIAIDEADKCPVPLARLIRAIATHTQQCGVRNLRFALAGVSPFFREMVDEDAGIARFFYRTISLSSMSLEEAVDLVETKLSATLTAADEAGLDVEIDTHVVPRLVSLAGGHPHLIQLLGSHLIEYENEDPDGYIDSRDLLRSLERVCFEDRARAYDSTLHMLEAYGQLEPLQAILAMAPRGFPTRVPRQRVLERIGQESAQWLVESNILSTPDSRTYGLVDEFLRIRVMLEGFNALDDEVEEEEINEEWLDSEELGLGLA